MRPPSYDEDPSSVEHPEQAPPSYYRREPESALDHGSAVTDGGEDDLEPDGRAIMELWTRITSLLIAIGAFGAFIYVSVESQPLRAITAQG